MEEAPMRRIRSRLTYANVLVTLAPVVAVAEVPPTRRTPSDDPDQVSGTAARY
jgi:hypothetical protein